MSDSVDGSRVDIAPRSSDDVGMPLDPAWQHPWLRLARLVRLIRETRWSAEAWPRAKDVPREALTMQRELRRRFVVELSRGRRPS